MKEKIFNTRNLILLCLIVVVFPFVVATLYALPSADDFSAGVGHNNLVTFSGALEKTIEIYFNWLGVYFTSITLYFIAPFDRFGITGLQIALLISIILFIVVLYWIIKTVFRYCFKIEDKSLVLAVQTLVLFILFNNKPMDEIFYWQTGMFGYTLPIILSLTSIGLIIKMVFEKICITQLLLLSIAIICANGGVLQVPALLCWVLLCIMVYSWILKHQNKMYFTILFIISLITALINVLAPGNYARADVINDEGRNLTEAIINMLRVTLKEIYSLNFNSLLPFLLVIVFVYVIIKAPKIKVTKWNNPITILGFYVGMALITIFPVTLGTAKGQMASRCYFILDLIIMIMEIIIVISLANWVNVKTKVDLKSENIIILGIVIFLGFISFNNFNPIIHDKWISSARFVLSGDISEYSNQWQDILNEITESDEKIIIIDNGKIESQLMIKSPGITSDKNDWVNNAAKDYYGKEEIYLAE